MRAATSLLLAVSALACAGGLNLERAPSEPIAFVLQSADSISSLDEFLQAVQPVGPASDDERRPLRTTIALLTVPDGRIDRLPDAGEGDLPLDWSADGLRLLVGREQRNAMRLFEWNRLTRAWDRMTPDLSLGSAALGGGPIRLALIERWPGPAAGAGSPSTGIVLEIDREGRVLLPGGAEGRDPDISADGRRVVFTRAHSRRGREPTIAVSEIGSGGARILGRGGRARFSRDGKWIVYVTHRRGNADVWLMRSDGSAKRPLVTSGFDDDFPSLSPDGRFVVYASARERGLSQLYMTSLDDGKEVQLTHTGQSGRPVW